MKVLAVDDSITMRKILTNVLVQMGATEVDQAADGDEAVVKVAKTTYDLVLLDWNMPNMTGLETIKEIRATGNAVPIIMVTTEGEKSKVIEAIKAGANNYVIKPFQKDVLVDKIQKTLGTG